MSPHHAQSEDTGHELDVAGGSVLTLPIHGGWPVWRRLAVAVAALLWLLASACSESSDDITPPPPTPPCTGVYSAAVNSCVAASGCIGFGCFFVWAECSANAKRGPLLECCVANYSSPEDRQRCMDMLGTGP